MIHILLMKKNDYFYFIFLLLKMQNIGDWEIYTDDSIRKQGWINRKTGKFSFKHPHYIATCEKCDKDIIREDDCLIKGGEDGNSTYCRNCYDENIWYDKQLEELLMKQEIEDTKKTKKQLQAEKKAEKEKEKQRQRETDMRYKAWCAEQDKKMKEANRLYEETLKMVKK